MSALVNYRDGSSRQLDAKPQPDEVVSEQDVADAPKLARLLTRILRELAALRRRWAPRSIVFTNVSVDGSGATVVSLTHHFDSAVNWSVVGWRNAAGGASLVENASRTDKNALALVSQVQGTADILVQERG